MSERPTIEVVARRMARHVLTEALRSGDVHEALATEGRASDPMAMALAAKRAEDRLWPEFAELAMAAIEPGRGPIPGEPLMMGELW